MDEKGPRIAGSQTTPTQLIDRGLAKLAAPCMNGLVGYDHTAFKEELFDTTTAKIALKVEPHSMADDIDRTPVILYVVITGCVFMPQLWRTE